MSEILSELKYTETHEWLRCDEANTVTVGITAHAQQQLGDVVFVELPQVELRVDVGDSCGVLESVKAAGDFYAPIKGHVVAVNEALDENPALINQDPYGDGWLIKIELDDASQLEALLDAEAYTQLVG